MKPFDPIETDRLILRKPRMEDAPAIYTDYAQDPEVTRYMTWRPHQNIEETCRIIEVMLGFWESGSAYSYALTLKGSDSVIGMIAAHPNEFKVEIGYVLARSHWGRGYMTEAARVMVRSLLAQAEVYRVFAVCDVHNPASARVMEKAGMQREGLLRKYTIHPNISDEPRDSYIYAIVK